MITRIQRLGAFLALAAAVVALGRLSSANDVAVARQQGPAPRHGMAWVMRADGTAVMFGGADHSIVPEVRHGDTWLWAGDSWIPHRDPGPSPRIWPAAAYDAQSGGVFLFGGLSPDSGFLTDAWLFRPKGWQRIETTTAPEGRWHSAMAPDPARAQLVLFGGVDHLQKPEARVYGDTWVWNGRAWARAEVQGPEPRFGHAMTFDPSREAVVLVGGRNRQMQPLNDAWAWDGRGWSRISAEGLPPRLLHALAFDPVGRSLILHGGWDATAGNYLGDTWRLQAGTWRRLDAAGPTPRRAHLMVTDRPGRRVLLFGGYGPNAVHADLWAWDGTCWKRLGPR